MHVSVGILEILHARWTKKKILGTTGYGDSYLEFSYRRFKIFRPHAVLHDATAAVKVHSAKGPGDCYMIWPGQNSCLLGYVTGLLFSPYVKLFLPSVFQLVVFKSTIPCIVLDIELTDINFINELEVFFDSKVRGYSFCPSEKYKPTKQAVWCTSKLHGIVCNSGRLDNSELPIILPSDVKGEYFAKETEKCKTFGTLMGEELEKLDDYGCP